MEITILGSGSAWGVPEHGCRCRICSAAREAGEERTRTSLVVRAGETILIDPGPDLRRQMILTDLTRPDAVLISHEHLDHIGGLDELLCFRRSRPREDWKPIPCYAHPLAWTALNARFGYLFGSLLEKRICQPGLALTGLSTGIMAFKTIHGPVARGSVGFILEHGGRKLVYTSDFEQVIEEPEEIKEADLLVLASHYFNEPSANRAHQLSLQNGLRYIARWRPRRILLVHLSAGDWVPGDPANTILKKIKPKNPLTDPNGRPRPVPLTTADWAETAPKVLAQAGLHIPVEPAVDGLKIVL